MERTPPVIAVHTLGDTLVEYVRSASGRVGLQIYPASLRAAVVTRRRMLDPRREVLSLGAGDFPAYDVDPLVQLKLAGESYPDGFAQGRTMRNGPSTLSLALAGQTVRREDDQTIIETLLTREDGLEALHALCWREGDQAFAVTTTVRNASPRPITLEMLASFSLGQITPFDRADAAGRLFVHRFRSAWSAEGRHERRSVEELQLERSWIGHSVACERFGRVGNLPVGGFFPFVAVEDHGAGVLWGAQLCWAGSWQMEVYRRDDCLAFSGGLADRELGHWLKTLAPGESFASPPARLACVHGDLDDLCDRLTALQHRAADAGPVVEQDLPIIYNDWCANWGTPTHEKTVALAERLAGSPVRYLVLDAGWYRSELPTNDDRRDGTNFSGQHGDWAVNERAFPEGLAATAEAVRARGLIPGLWFEMETCFEGSRAWSLAEHLLRRDGVPLTVGRRRFWDLRGEFANTWLDERLIAQLARCGFGYLKVDHNETIGLGCDGEESLGEGARRQVAASAELFRRIRRRLPELVIENCASGGHRLEPSMLELTNLNSFSDAHETPEIPIIAAALQRLILPRLLQVWAVLHRSDDERRLTYSLAATFLGRMCLSGKLDELHAWQWARATAAMELYRRVWPVIKHGRSRRFGPPISSWRHPAGWQGVLRVADDGAAALAVVHGFAGCGKRVVELPLPGGKSWQVAGALLASQDLPQIQGGLLACPLQDDFDACVVYLNSVD